MTALPLFWGEGHATEVLNGADQRAPVIRLLEKSGEVRSIDRADALPSSEKALLILVQPRGLRPEEFVAVDGWVRNGGRALIFADPMLIWPSRFSLGDPRRAPAMTILDPLFVHWGLSLDGPAEANDAMITYEGASAVGAGVGRWSVGKEACTLVADGRIADCRLGGGRAILVADADLVDLSAAPENEAVINKLLNRLAQ